MFGVANKVAIVTGSSSGIGEAIAIKFASEGAKVTLCGRSQEKLKAALEKCMKVNGNKADRLITVAGDLSNSETIRAIVSQTINSFGRIDILVPNAGHLFTNDSLTFLEEETFDKIVATNLKSTLFLVKAASEELAKTKGAIVVTSSVSSTMAAGYVSLTYSMTKAGLDHMTRCLSLDLGPKGVRINNIQPSFVPTSITRDFMGTIDIAKLQAGILATEGPLHPLHGRCAEPQNIADVVLFLASPSAKYITGQILAVDGGRNFMGPNQAIMNAVPQ